MHEIVAVGNTVILEKNSYKAWQKQYGRSVGLRAPGGMFVAHLRRTVARTGGSLIEDQLMPSCAQAVILWEASEARLRAAHERVVQRAKERQVGPRSFGIPRAGARRPHSLSEPTQEPTFLLTQGRLAAWQDHSEPPLLKQRGVFSTVTISASVMA